MVATKPALGLKHRTVSAAILDEVRRRVLDGTYPAGSQLRQDSLADEFGVSRIPVREALFQLEAEGFVRISPHKGATVAALSATDVAEACDLRALLEPRLLASSAPRLSQADYVEIEQVLTAYSAALTGGDTARWGELNTALHLLLYRRADAARTLGIVTGLLQECDRYTRLQLSTDQAELERADREHREIVALCRDDEIAAATLLLRKHINHVSKALARFLTVRSAERAR
jgi:DNA-binding GntR family transcriptional regulator